METLLSAFVLAGWTGCMVCTEQNGNMNKATGLGTLWISRKLEYFRNLLLEERRQATEVLRHKEETLSPLCSLG